MCARDVCVCVCVSLKPLSARSFCKEHCDLQLKESVLCGEVFAVSTALLTKTSYHHLIPVIIFIHPACVSLYCARYCSLKGWVSCLQTDLYCVFHPLVVSAIVGALFRLLPPLKPFFFPPSLQSGTFIGQHFAFFCLCKRLAHSQRWVEPHFIVSAPC